MRQILVYALAVCCLPALACSSRPGQQATHADNTSASATAPSDPASLAAPSEPTQPATQPDPAPSREIHAQQAHDELKRYAESSTDCPAGDAPELDHDALAQLQASEEGRAALRETMESVIAARLKCKSQDAAKRPG